MKMRKSTLALSAGTLLLVVGCAGTQEFSDTLNYTGYGTAGGEQIYVEAKITLTAHKLLNIGDYEDEILQHKGHIQSAFEGSLIGLGAASEPEILKVSVEEEIQTKLPQIGQKTLGRVTADSVQVTTAIKVAEGARSNFENYLQENAGFVEGGSVSAQDSDPFDGYVSGSTNVVNPKTGEAAVRYLQCPYKGPGSCKPDADKNRVGVPGVVPAIQGQ